MKEPETKPFLDWFAEQYDVGRPEPTNISQCIAYLSGIIDTIQPGEERFMYMRMCVSALRSFEVMSRALKQHNVQITD